MTRLEDELAKMVRELTDQLQEQTLARKHEAWGFESEIRDRDDIIRDLRDQLAERDQAEQDRQRFRREFLGTFLAGSDTGIG